MRTNKWEVVLYRYWTELGGGKPKLCGHGFKSTWQKSKHDLAWKLWDPVVHIVQIIHVFQTYTFFKWYSNTSYKPYTLTIRTHHAKIYIEPYEHCPYIQIMQSYTSRILKHPAIIYIVHTPLQVNDEGSRSRGSNVGCDHPRKPE